MSPNTNCQVVTSRPGSRRITAKLSGREEMVLQYLHGVLLGARSCVRRDEGVMHESDGQRRALVLQQAPRRMPAAKVFQGENIEVHVGHRVLLPPGLGLVDAPHVLIATIIAKGCAHVLAQHTPNTGGRAFRTRPVSELEFRASESTGMASAFSAFRKLRTPPTKSRLSSPGTRLTDRVR